MARLDLDHLTYQKLAHLADLAAQELKQHEQAGRTRAAKTRATYLQQLRDELARREATR